MSKPRQTRMTPAEVKKLRTRLAEAEETLQAIRRGEVDSLVVDGPTGPQVFTLQTLDQPYRILIEQMSEAAASLSDEGVILFCNQRLSDVVGQPREKLVGTAMSALVRESERPHFQQVLRQSLKGEARAQVQLRSASGGLVPVQLSLRLIEAEQLRSVCLVATDLSELRRKEQMLQLQQETLRQQAALLELAHDAILVTDAEGIITFWNHGAEATYGWTSYEAMGRKCHDLLQTRFPVPLQEIHRQVEERGSWEGELTHATRDGDSVVVASRWSLQKGEDGSARGILEINRDITERKRAEEALRRRETQFQLQIERMPVGYITWDREFRVRSWNPAAEAIFGFTADEAIGKHPYQFLVPESIQEAIDEIFDRLLQGDSTAHSTNENLTKDGRKILCHWTNTPLRENGNIMGVLSMVEDITARRQAEEALRQASRYTRSLIEASLDPLVTISREGKVRDVNEATEKITGMAREELIGSDYCDYFTEPDKARRGYEQVFADGFVRDYELAIRHRSGRVTNVLYNASVFRNEQGEIEGVFAAARDITSQKKAQEALQKASLYTRSLIEASLDPLVTISRDGKITDVNEAAEKATGIAREQLLGSDFCDYFTQPEKARQGYEQVFQTGVVRDYPLALRHHSGQVMEVLYNATVYQNQRGEVEGVLAAARDVTAQRQAEQKLRDQAALLDLAHDAIIFRGLDSRVLFWNRGAKDLYGWSAEEAVGQVAHELLRTEFPISLEELHATIHESREWEGELGHHCRDGKRIVVASRWSLLRDEQGHPTAVLEINRDITARKQAEEALRQASRYTRSLIEASLDPLVTISREGKITDVNEATEKVTGLDRRQLIGSDFSSYFADPDEARRGYERVFAEGSVRDYPLAIRNTSGQITDVVYNASVFKNQQGEVEGVFAVARDITQRKKAEEEVRKLNEELEQRVAMRTQELQAVNRELESFNYAVAHDLRAPLRHIHGFSEILADEAGSSLDASAQHHLEMIRGSVQHMERLLEDLLSLSRLGRQELLKKVCGLKALIEEVVEMLKPEMKDRAVDFRIGELPFLECDPGLMRQVLVNLLTNALKFTRPRPQAIIEIGQTSVEGEPVIFIRDNGVGFNMKYADKLFGLFQRLHRQEEFEGTGVGLAIVQRIIHKHGGQVWAEAELNRGATFYFKLQSCTVASEAEPTAEQLA